MSAPHQNVCGLSFSCLFSECKVFTPVFLQVPVWPARWRRPSVAVHPRSAQVDPEPDAKLQKWVHQWRERWLTHMSTHTHTRLSWSEKPVFSISNQAAGRCHVSLKVAEGREKASCLSVVPALSACIPPLRHRPPLPWGPTVYFFMNVWIRWKWGSIGFGFGFQSLTCCCTRTHTNSLFSLTHSFTDGLEQLTPIKLFLC